MTSNLNQEPEEIQEPIQQLKLNRIILPVLFSLGVAAFMIYKIYSELDIDALKKMEVEGASRWLLLICLLGMVLRDAAYIWRTKLLGGGELSWRSAFDVTLLWEFSNTVAPSLTGGTPLIIYMLIKEKLNAGKSTAIVFLTIFLDQFYFVLLVPIMVMVLGMEALFRPLMDAVGTGVYVTMWTAYTILALYGMLLVFGIFINPNAVKKLLIWIFNTRLLRRWHHLGEKVGEDLVIASQEFRDKTFSYWLKVVGATIIAWASRFLVLNILFLTFAPHGLNFAEHLLIFGRQSILFVLMFVAVTPGGSGLAEFSFMQVLSDLCGNFPGGCGLLALLWRAIGFYPYMLLGIWLLPRWIRRIYGKK